MKQQLHLKQPPKNILIISMRYLGDVLLTTPLIRTIKTAYPNSNIDVLVYSHTPAMLEGNSDIREVIATPQRPSAKEYILLLKKIFRKYDLSIVTQTGDRRFIYGLLSSPVRASIVPALTEKNAWKRRFIQGWVEFNTLENHTVLEFLSLSGILGISPQYKIIPPYRNSFQAPAGFSLSDQYAVIHLLPQWTYKRWNQQAWLETIGYLKKQGLKIIFSGGPDENEIKYIESIRNLSPENTQNIAGKVSLADLSLIISKSKLFIGPDTGITHLASATGTPTIAIFGPTNPIKWAPWPKNYALNINPFSKTGNQTINNVYLIQGKGDCVPCLLEGCDNHRDSHSQCLDSLAASDIELAITDILEKY